LPYVQAHAWRLLSTRSMPRLVAGTPPRGPVTPLPDACGSEPDDSVGGGVRIELTPAHHLCKIIQPGSTTQTESEPRARCSTSRLAPRDAAPGSSGCDLECMEGSTAANKSSMPRCWYATVETIGGFQPPGRGPQGASWFDLPAPGLPRLTITLVDHKDVADLQDAGFGGLIPSPCQGPTEPASYPRSAPPRA
jgi:hypothetical protein